MDSLIRLCFDILSLPLNLLGYSITLGNVMVFFIIGSLLLHFIYRLLK